MCIVYINEFIYDFMLTYHAVYGSDNTNWFYICLQVQSELKRKWRSLRLKRYIGRDYRLHSSSISKNGTENTAQFHRNSRAQSFLQTETTVVWDIPRTEATLYESCSYFTAPQLTTRFFPQSFTLKRTRLSEAWDWHAGGTMRIRHLYLAVFSVQRKISLAHQNNVKPNLWVRILVALKTRIQITICIAFL